MIVENYRGVSGWRLLAGVGFGLFATAGCANVIAAQHSQTVQGSGKKAAENRKVAPFHGVDLAGSGTVTYTVGSAQSVRVETDDNLLPHVETVVKDGVLRIGYKGSYNTQLGIKVTITAPSCDTARLSGSGDVHVTGVKAGKFEGEITGSGKVVVVGSANSATAAIAGSGDLDLSQLRTGDTSAEVTGSGTVRVAPTGALSASITGSGNVRYTGSPKSVNKRVTGSGTVTRG